MKNIIEIFMKNGRKKILIDDSNESIDETSSKLCEILFSSDHIICLVTKNDDKITFTNVRPSEVILSSIEPLDKITKEIEDEIKQINIEKTLCNDLEENVIIDSIPSKFITTPKLDTSNDS